MRPHVLGPQERVHPIASRCPIAPVGFHVVAGLECVARRAEIPALRPRARADRAARAIRGDQ